MIVLLAICMGGLEELAKEQLELAGAYTVEILPSSKINLTSKTSNIHRGEAGVGKLKVEIFESQKEKNEIINNNDNKYCINFETLYSKVKMIQYWMIYVNHYTDISNNTDDVLGIKIQKTKKLKLSTEEKDEEKEEIITEEERDGGYLYDNLIKLDYSYYLKQWQKCLQNNSFEEINDENENENSSSSTSSISTYLSPSFEPRFTLRCIRDGNHEYNSLDFSKRLGDIINEKTNWKIDLINMNLEIITFLLNEILIIGFNIPINPKKKFIKNKLPCETKLSILELSALKVLENEEYYEQNQNKNKNEKNIVENELEKKRKFKLKGLPLLNPPLIYENLTKLPAIALRPSTAASFLVLSQPKLGDVLLDFNYAEGSITSDHIHDYFNLKFSSNKFSSTLPPCILLTGCPDYNLHNVLNRTLSIMNNQKKIADGFHWVPHRLPIVKSSVDCCYLSIPFRKITNGCPNYYRAKLPKVIKEVARVLSPNGRCVMMLQSIQQLLSLIDSKYFIGKELKYYCINNGGYLGYIVKFVRSEEVYVETDKFFKEKFNSFIEE